MKQLEDSGVDEVSVDSAGLPCAAAEGAFLSSWSYKKANQIKFPSLIEPLKNAGKFLRVNIFQQFLLNLFIF